MMRIALLVALAPIALAGHAPTLGSSVFVKPSQDRLMALRGGRTLGPLDADVLSNVALAVHGAYSIELAIPALTNPSRKYFGAMPSSWLTWFGTKHAFSTAVLLYAKFKLKYSAKDVLLYLTAWNGLSAAVLAYQKYEKRTLKDGTPLVVTCTLAALGLYVLYA
mmetsp:Transcript_11892/g.35242  ORF Transcript_11892/g.35242 Transcript_11892/m.35242 type:complete len:164 (+) Transcript_11892:43-534(+)